MGPVRQVGPSSRPGRERTCLPKRRGVRFGAARCAATRAHDDDDSHEQQRHEDHQLNAPVELARVHAARGSRRSMPGRVPPLRRPRRRFVVRPGLGVWTAGGSRGIELREIDLDRLPTVGGRDGHVPMRGRVSPSAPAARVTAVRPVGAEQLAAVLAERRRPRTMNVRRAASGTVRHWNPEQEGPRRSLA